MVRAHSHTTDQPLSIFQWTSGLIFAIALVFSALPSGLTWDTKLTTEMMEGSWIVMLQSTGQFMWAWLLVRSIPRVVLAQIARANWSLMLAYCTISLIWSDFPGIVIKRFVQFLVHWSNGGSLPPHD